MAFLASIALSVALSAQTTLATAPAADLAALIARLAADDSGERDAAQQSILALPGDPTLDLRTARAKTTDPDVRLRIDAMLVQARERFELGASRVTLTFDDAPLSKVIDELERQSRARFADLGPEFGDQQPRVTIDARDVTFWDAIARVQKAGNVVFQPSGGGPDGGWRVTRNFGPMAAVRGVESGAFLFQPLAANYSRTVGYAANNVADREVFNLTMTMLAEPKIRLSEQAAQVVLDHARDARGNDLMPATRNPTMASVGPGQSFSVPLAYPKQPADTIAEIGGVVRLAVANRVVAIESDDLFGDGKIERQIEGTKLTIEAVGSRPDAPARGNRPAANDGRIELNVTIDRGNVNGSPIADQVQRAMLRARVIDPSGRPMQQAGLGGASADPSRITFRVIFAPQQPPPRRADGTPAVATEGAFKLRADLPVGFRSVEVPFTLKDLKMP